MFSIVIVQFIIINCQTNLFKYNEIGSDSAMKPPGTRILAQLGYCKVYKASIVPEFRHILLWVVK
jgi:hypothetical protein